MDFAALRETFDHPAPYDRLRFQRLEAAVTALLDAKLDAGLGETVVSEAPPVVPATETLEPVEAVADPLASDLIDSTQDQAQA